VIFLAEIYLIVWCSPHRPISRWISSDQTTDPATRRTARFPAFCGVISETAFNAEKPVHSSCGKLELTFNKETTNVHASVGHAARAEARNWSRLGESVVDDRRASWVALRCVVREMLTNWNAQQHQAILGSMIAPARNADLQEGFVDNKVSIANRNT